MAPIDVLQRDIEALGDLVRAKYYLSQTLQQQDLPNEEATLLEQESMQSLQQILQQERLGKAALYDGDFPILFDYIVQWECRLVTPRRIHNSPRVNFCRTSVEEV
ncbi:MAG: hypothetical protein Q9167_004060 [Letrouitia subvulpina]